jgi:phosphopantothenoylcysteine decarboxylase
MNTMMWEHPFTAKQLDILRQLGVVVIDPISKRLACGDLGYAEVARRSRSDRRLQSWCDGER